MLKLAEQTWWKMLEIHPNNKESLAIGLLGRVHECVCSILTDLRFKVSGTNSINPLRDLEINEI